MTDQRKVDIMQHYLDGGAVLQIEKGTTGKPEKTSNPLWDWENLIYEPVDEKFLESTGLYVMINSACNKADSNMIDMTSDMKETPCVTTKGDIFTKMYKTNEAFKLLCKARSLVRDL